MSIENTNKLNLKWVTDVIKEDYKKWNSKDIITIQAQTGTGKTFFIKNKLVPYAYNNKYKILILCNRVMLKRQLKKDLFEYFNMPIPNTLCELDEVETIKNVTICSYQKYGEKLDKTSTVNFSEYNYIVCDECHFLLTDASFNNRCDYLVDLLIGQKGLTLMGCETIRIFISATIDEVIERIDKLYIKENGNVIGKKRYKLHKYTTNMDYSYLDVRGYTHINEIVKTINNSTQDNEKWLIFVTNNEIGKSIKEDLSGVKNAKFINAENKIGDEIKNIVDNSKFDCDVLIATKVLDNGVNIFDKEVKNIVIEAWDKTTFIQELGRLRVDINNPHRINLYIPQKSVKSFKTKIETYYKPIEEDVKLLNENRDLFNVKYHNNYSELKKTIFRLNKETNEWEINNAGLERFNNDYEFFKKMVKLFGKGKKYNKDAFLEEQLKWIGLTKYDLIEVLDNVEGKTNAQIYIDNHIGQKLDKEQQKELANILGIKDKRGRLRTSIKIINAYLEEEFNVNCVSKRFTVGGNKETYWILGNK